MPKTVISYRFQEGTNTTSYLSDRGDLLTANSRFVLPPDLTLTDANTIVTAIQGEINTEPGICSDSNYFDMRRLIFIRSSGNTMSLAVPFRGETLLTAAANIVGVLDGANGGNNKVVCVKMKGENFPNLNDELGVSHDGIQVAQSHKAPATASKQNFLSGPITYSNDFGTSGLHPVRSITEKTTDEPAAQLGTVWDSCTGGIKDVLSCGGSRRNPRKHRRYILTFLTKNSPADDAETSQSETIELPVAGVTPGDINVCGNAAAALPGLYCIGYRGESYDRVHKLLP